jgi:hypothetical protein
MLTEPPQTLDEVSLTQVFSDFFQLGSPLTWS